MALNSQIRTGVTHAFTYAFRRNVLPLGALVAVLVGGMLLLWRADAQARDTIRKHHLQDIERALYVGRAQSGTYPPHEQATWCGLLNDPANAAVRAEVEAALRKQNDKYANAAKPFPTDPDIGTSGPTYFYWKRSPASFELFGQLEADSNGTFDLSACAAGASLASSGKRQAMANYGLTSVLREDLPPEL